MRDYVSTEADKRRDGEMATGPDGQHRSPFASVAVLTDSTADLDPALAAAAGIAIVPVTIRLGAGAFPERVPGELPGDSGPGWPLADDADLARVSDAFFTVLQQVLTRHDAVIAILLSSRLGDAVAAARAARGRLADPARVVIVDSRSASAGLGMQVLRAAELARGGASLEAIAADIEAERDRYHVVFSVESAEHLRQSGQIGRAAAMIAEALQLKPLLRIDEGQIVPYERARTRAGAIAELARFAGQLPAAARVVVLYTTEPDDARLLAHEIAAETRIPLDVIDITPIGPAVAAHVGPGALGVVVVEEEA